MSRTDFGSINNLSDLRAERRRVHRELRRAERKLNDDYIRFTNMLTPEYLIGYLSRSAGNFLSMALSGFDLAMGLIRGRKSRKKR